MSSLPLRILSNSQVAALETQQIIDINNDGTVGVTVLDELVSRYSDASGGIPQKIIAISTTPQTLINSSEDNHLPLVTLSGHLSTITLRLRSLRIQFFGDLDTATRSRLHFSSAKCSDDYGQIPCPRTSRW